MHGPPIRACHLCAQALPRLPQDRFRHWRVQLRRHRRPRRRPIRATRMFQHLDRQHRRRHRYRRHSQRRDRPRSQVLLTTGRASHTMPEPTWSVCAGGTLAWGALRSNECPANYFRIVDEGACRSAAAAAGQAYDKLLAKADYPQGCFMSESTALSESTAVYYNIMGTTSTGQPQSKLLCSGARVSLHAGPGSQLGAYQGQG
jgi:hypothetical protein